MYLFLAHPRSSLLLSYGGLATQPPMGKYPVDMLPQSVIIPPSEYFVSNDNQELPFAVSGVVLPATPDVMGWDVTV